MKVLTAICALVLALPSAGLAQSDAPTPGRDLAELIFGAIEDNPYGTADMGEFITFGEGIFVSMDYDESGSITFNEFTEWDFGFNFIAADEGQDRAYQTAQKVLFAIWDHDGNGEIGQQEYQKSMVWDFRRADTDGDAFLTRAEFLSGYIVNLAYRAAITGQ
ncbi:signal transduction protein [Octadecabacter sp. G9-8]|uniref:Signal transduction protein n=1 Tax=Octadecabacter dasysiphoniae TaxID=2909341 RepID=A0ABS9CUT0_9RHOB|nr:signal transduction protein [Octadecabacter dasysiphoniae]MCF2870517.1 signal transduction protein [Octadecabacter dasysiphoniae]